MQETTMITIAITTKATPQKVLSLPDADELHSRMIDRGYRSPLSYKNGISLYLKSKSLD